MTESRILSARDIRLKIDRLAFRIMEDHHEHRDLVLIGIRQGGHDLARLLAEAIERVDDAMDVEVRSLTLDKASPIGSVQVEVDGLDGRHVIMVDDVANSGKTLFHAFAPLVGIPMASLGICVLVDRIHKRFPVQAEYVGMALNTTLQEHIRVVFDAGEPTGAWLH